MASSPPQITLSLNEASLDALAEAIADRVEARSSRRTDSKENEGWLDSKGAAEYLALSVPAIHRLTAAQEIPFFQDQPRGRCFFKRSVLDRWRLTNAKGPAN